VTRRRPDRSDIKIDRLDREIISLLQPDGRRPFSDVAEELGVSEGTIRQRYQRLTGAGILQVVGVADPFKVGFQSMAMIGINVAIEGDRSIDEVAGRLASLPQVSYVVMSTGGFDLLVEVILESNEELVRFLQDKVHRTQGVTKTETFMLLRVYKMNLGGWRTIGIPSESLEVDAAIRDT
jgi:Lrp/AsnC family transcriptional regulator for asnA, asnC and gidA